ncbi:MAG: hypothetical protein PHG25_03400 [Candidatus Pacebacteria bacterium]|nr:hypothetical protein [Candidatus Paceibacterota bacterium]
MSTSKYAVIPTWVFQRIADWQEFEIPDEHTSGRAYTEARSFFENNHNKSVYIVEAPTSHVEQYNQEYLPQLMEMAENFGARIIKSDSPEARRFYLDRVKEKARGFEKASNPFSSLVVGCRFGS